MKVNKTNLYHKIGYEVSFIEKVLNENKIPIKKDIIYTNVKSDSFATYYNFFGKLKIIKEAKVLIIRKFSDYSLEQINKILSCFPEDIILILFGKDNNNILNKFSSVKELRNQVLNIEEFKKFINEYNKRDT